MHYRLNNREALEACFHNQAKRMRDDGLQRFGNRFTAARRILHPLIR